MVDSQNQSSTRLISAVAFAAQYHRDQRRKGHGDIPYINHPLEVARILSEDGGIDEVEVIMAAVLHDTVEDTEATIDEISQKFGPVVARYVAEVTDDKSLAKADRKARQVLDAPKKSVGAKAIKLADKTSNLRDLLVNPPANWSRDRLWNYAQWSRRVGDGLRGHHPRLEIVFDQALEAAESAFRPSQAADTL